MTPLWAVVLLGTPAIGVSWGIAAWWLDAHGQRRPSRAHYDAIIVAGCRVMPDGRPSPALARRVALAVALYEAGLAPCILLTGGRGPEEPIPEALAAATMCAALGVPPEALVLEDRSRTTLQNAAFAAHLVSGDVLVVSDSYHAFRCARVFGRYFARADAVGVLPDGRSRVRLALREVVAVVRHGVAGRL